MLGAVGLALLSGPFVSFPTPVYGGEPALIVLASDPANLRLRCYSTQCGDREWRLAGDAKAQRLVTASRAPVRLPGSHRRAPLSAPATRRDAAAHYADHFRVGTTYGYDALRDGDTRLGLNFGAGYRLAPLHDDGVRRAGPVFRGELRVGQRLGERAEWTQRIQVEAGRDDTFVKQSIGLDVALWPEWTLETDAVIRHRPDADTLRTAEGWLGIRRRF